MALQDCVINGVKVRIDTDKLHQLTKTIGQMRENVEGLSIFNFYDTLVTLCKHTGVCYQDPVEVNSTVPFLIVNAITWHEVERALNLDSGYFSNARFRFQEHDLHSKKSNKELDFKEFV